MGTSSGLLSKFAQCAVLCALLLIAPVCRAALVVSDFQSSGDRLLVTDTSTGLDWLSPRATNTVTYNAVVGGYDGLVTTRGFSVASAAQVQSLIAKNFDNPTTADSADNVPKAQAFFNVFGITAVFTCPTLPCPRTQGWALDSGNLRGLGMITLNNNASGSLIDFTSSLASGGALLDTQRGTWLVRPARLVDVSGAGSSDLFGFFDTQRVGQTFTAPITFLLGTVRAAIVRQHATDSAVLRVELWTTDGTLPVARMPGSSAIDLLPTQVPAASDFAGFDMSAVSVDFSSQNLMLTAGTTYALVYSTASGAGGFFMIGGSSQAVSGGAAVSQFSSDWTTAAPSQQAFTVGLGVVAPRPAPAASLWGLLALFGGLLAIGARCARGGRAGVC